MYWLKQFSITQQTDKWVFYAYRINEFLQMNICQERVDIDKIITTPFVLDIVEGDAAKNVIYSNGYLDQAEFIKEQQADGVLARILENNKPDLQRYLSRASFLTNFKIIETGGHNDAWVHSFAANDAHYEIVIADNNGSAPSSDLAPHNIGIYKANDKASIEWVDGLADVYFTNRFALERNLRSHPIIKDFADNFSRRDMTDFNVFCSYFDDVGTGGGCNALTKPLNNDLEMVLTEKTGFLAPSDPDAPLLMGVYKQGEGWTPESQVIHFLYENFAEFANDLNNNDFLIEYAQVILSPSHETQFKTFLTNFISYRLGGGFHVGYKELPNGLDLILSDVDATTIPQSAQQELQLSLYTDESLEWTEANHVWTKVYPNFAALQADMRVNHYLLEHVNANLC